MRSSHNRAPSSNGRAPSSNGRALELEQSRAELEQSRAEQRRLALLSDEREEDYQARIAEAEARRDEAERNIATVLFKYTQLEKALADQRVELRSLNENARNLEGLAAAGRAALEIARDLHTVVEAVDARTQHLLAQSSTEEADRHVIEALRDDAIAAASLTRQIVKSTAAAPGFGDIAGGRDDAGPA